MFNKKYFEYETVWAVLVVPSSPKNVECKNFELLKCLKLVNKTSEVLNTFEVDLTSCSVIIGHFESSKILRATFFKSRGIVNFLALFTV